MTSRVLGLDHGTKRVGIALSDPGRVVAHPLEVVARVVAVARVQALAEEHEVSLIVIGLPTTLSGAEGSAARGAKEFGEEVRTATGRQVLFVDERFTSNTAEKAMIEAGTRRRRRREAIDMVAATVILQSFLDRPQ